MGSSKKTAQKNPITYELWGTFKLEFLCFQEVKNNLNSLKAILASALKSW